MYYQNKFSRKTIFSVTIQQKFPTKNLFDPRQRSSLWGSNKLASRIDKKEEKKSDQLKYTESNTFFLFFMGRRVILSNDCDMRNYFIIIRLDSNLRT